MGVLLALHWNGRSWSQAPFPSTSGQIVSLSGTSPNDIWAAGFFYNDQDPRALLYHYNGAKWKPYYIEGLFSPSLFSAVSASASNDAWLVGYGEVFPTWSNYISNVTYHWNGKRWADVRNPDQIGCCELLGVSSRTSADAWAVGQGGTYQGTFTMRFGTP
jgi:hypothetical protein